MSDNTRKTIVVNPELFRASGSGNNNKTRKKLEAPLIAPNTLKSKLLRRIKDHQKKDAATPTPSPPPPPTDEFSGAMSYLSELSKKAVPHVELELPFDLQERPLEPATAAAKYAVDKEVQYGCLRGGQKPTYRNWTRKANPVMSREERLQKIRQRLQSLEQPAPMLMPEPAPIPLTPTIPEPAAPMPIPEPAVPTIPIPVPAPAPAVPTIPVQAPAPMIPVPEESQQVIITNIEPLDEKEANKQKEEKMQQALSARMRGGKRKKDTVERKRFTRRTTLKKYTLGKSKKFRRVGILLKNAHTRKKVVEAQRELKQTPLTDVKKYLHRQGILRAGSTAPSEILRKTYESAMLAGDVINTNKEVLLHNLMQPDDEE